VSSLDFQFAVKGLNTMLALGDAMYNTFWYLRSKTY